MAMMHLRGLATIVLARIASGLTQASGLTLDRRVLLRGSGAALAVPLLPAQAGSIPTWDLGGGVAMPTLALNTVGLSVEATERAVKFAVEAGICHVDFHPGIERDGVARALKSLPRDALFLTTKVRSPQNNLALTPTDAADLVKRQLEEDRKILGVEKVDMWMLRETPNCDVIQAQWRVLEDAQRAGVVGALGVVNYCEKQLMCLLKTAQIKPALDYYCLHPGMGRDAHGLRSYAAKRGVKTFAYGAIGEPGPVRAQSLGRAQLKVTAWPRAGAANFGKRRAAENRGKVRRLASSSGGALELAKRQRRKRPADRRVWARRVGVPHGRLVRERPAGPRLRRGGVYADEAGDA